MENDASPRQGNTQNSKMNSVPDMLKNSETGKDCPCLKKLKLCKTEEERRAMIPNALLCFAETPTTCLSLMSYLRGIKV
jgi:hypothetical protein